MKKELNPEISKKRSSKKNRAPSIRLDHQFLIATPAIQDDVFKKSVIYVCEHTNKGAIGLIINHPIQSSLDVVFKQLDIKIIVPEVAKTRLMMGGPMSQEHGFVLHRDTGKKWRSSIRMPDGLCVTTSHDVLESIAAGDEPHEMMLTLGYAAWEPGQLEKELAQNDWLICPADVSLLFDVPVDKRWDAAGALLGVNMKFLSVDIGHA